LISACPFHCFQEWPVLACDKTRQNVREKMWQCDLPRGLHC
jgi:hypothetical protein